MIQGRDFTCMRETVNAIEAWLGYCRATFTPMFVAADLTLNSADDAVLSRPGGAGTG